MEILIKLWTMLDLFMANCMYQSEITAVLFSAWFTILSLNLIFVVIYSLRLKGKKHV